MVAKLKDKGMLEVKSLRKRAMQVAGLGRCAKHDADFIVEHCDEIIARIDKMKELPTDNSDRGNLW